MPKSGPFKFWMFWSSSWSVWMWTNIVFSLLNSRRCCGPNGCLELFGWGGKPGVAVGTLLRRKKGWDTVDGRNPKEPPGMRIKPCKEWDVYHVNWCRISSINRFIKKLKQENSGPINQYEPYLVNSALVTSDVSYEKQHIKVCQMYPPLHLNYHQIHMPTTHFLYYLLKKVRCSYTVCARLRWYFGLELLSNRRFWTSKLTVRLGYGYNPSLLIFWVYARL